MNALMLNRKPKTGGDAMIKRCDTCKKLSQKKTCKALKEMIGIVEDCWAWSSDPDWERKWEDEKKSYEAQDQYKRENRIVSGWLLFYEERKLEHERNRIEVIEKLPAGATQMPPNDGTITNTTQAKTEKMEKFEREGKWIEIIEEAEKELPVKLRMFLQARRECAHASSYPTGRPSWVPYVQRRYAEEMAKHSGKSEEDIWVEDQKTFWVWWNRIVEYVARQAAKKGFFKQGF